MKLKTVLRVARIILSLPSRLDSIERQLSLRDQCIIDKQYLSKREAALYLDKTTHYIDLLIKDKKIGYYQPIENGYACYIKREDLDRFITGNVYFMSRREISAKARKEREKR